MSRFLYRASCKSPVLSGRLTNIHAGEFTFRGSIPAGRGIDINLSIQARKSTRVRRPAYKLYRTRERYSVPRGALSPPWQASSFGADHAPCRANPFVAWPLRRLTNAWHKVGTSSAETDRAQHVRSAARGGPHAHAALRRARAPAPDIARALSPWGGLDRWARRADTHRAVRTPHARPKFPRRSEGHAPPMRPSVGTRHRELILQFSWHARMSRAHRRNSTSGTRNRVTISWSRKPRWFDALTCALLLRVCACGQEVEAGGLAGTQA
ncbi:hypothetical protein C8Q77DRAFT_349339 [Trametes polyzona]|nr:hypothetical protein C8Q77DRAFT_349339 [Trametes polyzona]